MQEFFAPIASKQDDKKPDTVEPTASGEKVIRLTVAAFSFNFSSLFVL